MTTPDLTPQTSKGADAMAISSSGKGQSAVSDDRKAQLVEYRKFLVDADQKSQGDFDKTVLSLSGGALGISFIFLKDVIGPNPINSPDLLFASWVSWGASTFVVLASYFFSHLALRKAIDQIDNGTIDDETPGGHYRRITAFLNALGAILFLVGVCTITLFASENLKSKGVLNDGSQKTASSPKGAASSPAPTASAASQPTPSR